MTPLHLAAACCELEVMKLLLAAKADVNAVEKVRSPARRSQARSHTSQFNCTPLFLACLDGFDREKEASRSALCVFLLLEAPLTDLSISSCTELPQSITQGIDEHCGQICLLRATWIPIMSLLMTAFFPVWLVCQLLPDSDEMKDDKRTAVTELIWPKVQGSEFLTGSEPPTACGIVADLNHVWTQSWGQRVWGKSPLHIAVMRGNKKSVSALLDRGAPVNTMVRRPSHDCFSKS